MFLLLIVPVSCIADDPEPIQTEFVFEIKAQLSAAIELGQSKDGRRLAIPITGGSFEGKDIRGEVIPGGADYQLVRPDGIIEVRAVYMIRTDDGAVINVENLGIIDVADGNRYIRTTPKFSAPIGPYDWLNRHIFLSALRVDPDQPGYVFVQVYKVL